MSDGLRERIKARIDELDLTMTQVNDRCGLGPTFVNDIVNGKTKSPSAENLVRLATALETSLVKLIFGDDKISLNLSITGIVGGHDMWTALPPSEKKAVLVEFKDKDLINLIVDGTDYEPRYSRGDVLVGSKTTGKNLDNLIGTECIVETRSGEKYVRKLLRGSKPSRYNLRGHDVRDADIRDADIKWAAPISMILRGVV